MDEYIALDCHRQYSLLEREERASGRTRQRRIEHRPGAIRRGLQGLAPGTPVALETTGNWYWIAQEIEAAGGVPQLTHARKAKLMMGLINKTDKLDVHGLNRLQRNGTLPTVWLPPAQLRDQRELTRGRMVLSRQRTRLKNRLSATLAKYGRRVEGHSDSFSPGARAQLEEQIRCLPEQTRWISNLLLEELDLVQRHLKQQEERLKELLAVTPAMRLLQSLPGVGLILAGVLALELGPVQRFASAQRLASYAGTTPRVCSSGDKTRYGRLRPDVNRYAKWALVEAANVVVLNQRHYPDRHVTQLYRRLKARKGHAKAVGAVARHLAEAAWHVLSREEDYREPKQGRAKEA